MKTTIIKILLILTFLFITLWLTDTILPTFNPDYRPLLDFLRIISGFLQITAGMP